jgi:hypothetical protein
MKCLVLTFFASHIHILTFSDLLELRQPTSDHLVSPGPICTPTKFPTYDSCVDWPKRQRSSRSDNGRPFGTCTSCTLEVDHVTTQPEVTEATHDASRYQSPCTTGIYAGDRSAVKSAPRAQTSVSIAIALLCYLSSILYRGDDRASLPAASCSKVTNPLYNDSE